MPSSSASRRGIRDRPGRAPRQDTLLDPSDLGVGEGYENCAEFRGIALRARSGPGDAMVGGMRPGAGRPPADQSRAKDREAARAAKGLPAKSGKPKVIDDGDFLMLPREGRGGNPPAWPLSTATKREREVWRRLWKMPQGLAWERLGTEINVAMYCRLLVRAEAADSSVSAITLVRRYADGLGLSPAGLRLLHWRIGQPAKVADVKSSAAPQPNRVLNLADYASNLSPKQRMQHGPSGDGAS